MTVETTVAKVTANGNGAATVFSYSPIVIFAASDLVVAKRSASGVETILAAGLGVNNYIVNQTVFPGTGSITYPADLELGSALAVGESLTIKRVLPILQETDLENQGGYFADTQEQAFDRLTMISLQQQEAIDRAPKAPLSAPAGVDYTMPLPVPGAVASVWNAEGTGLVIGPVAGDIVGAGAAAALAVASAAEAGDFKDEAELAAAQAVAARDAAIVARDAAAASAASIPALSSLMLRGYHMDQMRAADFQPHPFAPCGALAVKSVGGALTSYVYLAFPYLGSTEAVGTYVLPPSYRGVGPIYARVLFAPKGGQEGDFRWYVRMARIGGNSTLVVDGVPVTAQDAADVYVASTVGDLRYSSGLLEFDSPGASAATETQVLAVVVGRDPSLEANSYEDDGHFFALELYVPLTDGNDQGIL